MNKTGKIVTILLWVLLIVSAVLIVSLMVNINEEVKTDPAMNGWVNTNLVWAYILNKFINDGTLTESIAKMVDAGLYATYILLAIAIVSIAVSPVIRMFR